jgi:hypothetical protein
MGAKMSKSNHPEYLITLKVLPDDSTDGDGYRRLRAFLKSARRAWRLQCTAIRPAAAADFSSKPGPTK